MSAKKLSGFKEFVIAAIKEPRQVSTLFPTLRFLASAMIDRSGMKPGDHVLELGCGSGAITEHILKQRGSLASYTGVEISENLIDFLRVRYPEENFLLESADNLGAHIQDSSIDVIVSSLPWTIFPEELQKSILSEIERVLKPDGAFVTFLCVHALHYPGANRVKKLFGETFSSFGKKQTISANIPPAQVFVGKGLKPKVN